MGPRRIFVALAVLALVVVAGTATVAFASDAPGRGSAGADSGRLSPSERRAQEAGTSADDDHSGDVHSRDVHPGEGSAQGSNNPGNGPVTQEANGGSGGAGGSDVGVTSVPGGAISSLPDGISSSAGILPAPIEAPAAAASGPAPDAAAAAPEFTVLAAGPAPTEAPAPPGNSAAPTAEPAPLAGLPSLGVIGAIPDAVADPPSAARAILSSGTGRSLAVIVGLLIAIVVFLAIHRRADRGDRKLAAARTGPDLASFR
jgi:hypothetical protein